MPKFTATHGVSFADLDIAFTYDAELSSSTAAVRPETGNSRVYSVDLDSKQAAALRKVDSKVLKSYGIAEVELTAEEKQAEKEAAEKAAAEKKAADEKAAADKAAAEKEAAEKAAAAAAKP